MSSSKNQKIRPIEQKREKPEDGCKETDDHPTQDPYFLLEADEEPNPRDECHGLLGIHCLCGRMHKRKVLEEGTFLCPVCHGPKHYKRKEAFLACHILFVPLFCCGSAKEIFPYVKCRDCGNHFRVEVLEAQKPKAFEKAVVGLMARMLIDTKKRRKLSESDLDCIRQTYMSLTNTNVTTHPIEPSHEVSGSIYMTIYLLGIAHILTTEQKELVVKAMTRITTQATRSDDLDAEEKTLVVDTGRGLGLAYDHIESMIKTEIESGGKEKSFGSKKAERDIEAIVATDC